MLQPGTCEPAGSVTLQALPWLCRGAGGSRQVVQGVLTCVWARGLQLRGSHNSLVHVPVTSVHPHSAVNEPGVADLFGAGSASQLPTPQLLIQIINAPLLSVPALPI
jgi:hypothetical protein